MLTDRASKGKTDIETRLLLTICTKADNEAEAQSILDGLVKDIRPDFESMGSGLTVLSGAEWLEIVAGVFWPSDVLVFDWATLVDTKTGKATGLTTKRAPWPLMSPRVRAAHPQPRPNGTTSVVKDSGIYPLQRFLRLDAAAAQVARHDRRQDGERHHLDAHGHDVHHPHAAHVGRELAQGDRRLHRRRRGRHARPCQGRRVARTCRRTST